MDDRIAGDVVAVDVVQADRLPLSALVLARDETADLAELLPTLAFAAEVVVVWDPRGDPATRAQAERNGARVFTNEWQGFGAQRRFALERCTQPWVLWIDADERLDPAARRSLAAAVRAGDAGAEGYTIERVSFLLGGRIRFCGWRDERLLRFFRRERGAFDDALVHESLALQGPVGRLEGVLEHRSYETWETCVTKMLRYAEAGAEQAYRAGRRAGALDGIVRAPLRFVRQYVLQLGFLDGGAGSCSAASPPRMSGSSTTGFMRSAARARRRDEARLFLWRLGPRLPAQSHPAPGPRTCRHDRDGGPGERKRAPSGAGRRSSTRSSACVPVPT